MTKVDRTEDVRRNKAKNLRYKKAAVSGLTLWEIREKLGEITEACDEVVYWMDSDDQTLVDALDGDDEDAERFKADFAVLSADADRMNDDLYSVWEPERFDDILVVSGIGNQRGETLMGYDTYECDYYGIDPFLGGWAEKESTKRLERLTKKELLEQVAQTVSITFAFLGIQSRYQDLKAAMDILRAQNKEYLDSVKLLNELHAQLWNEWGHMDYKVERQMDAIIQRMPQEAFL